RPTPVPPARRRAPGVTMGGVTTGKIRVLIVDASRACRERLSSALAGPEFEIAGEAESGRGAVEACAILRPDVIVLDPVLPGMSGVAAIGEIMARCPTPILLVSAVGRHAERQGALEAGAVDGVEKPPPAGDIRWDARFRTSLRVVSSIRVVTR